MRPGLRNGREESLQRVDIRGLDQVLVEPRFPTELAVRFPTVSGDGYQC